MILTVTPNPCVDKTLYISELKVGAFMRSKKYGCVPGGKGCNVSRAVNALGRPTKAMVLVGHHAGAFVVEMIEQGDGVQCVPVWVEAPTRTITTVLEEPIHRQTAFFEPGPDVTDAETEDFINTFLGIIDEARVVTFNGTVPDRTMSFVYADLIEIAKERDVITILDSHGEEFAQGVEAQPYMVKPNLAETRELVGFDLDTNEAKWKAVDWYHNKGIELVVLSMGKQGALVSRGDSRFHVSPPAINEVNPVGSGDALVAGFAVGLMEDASLEDAARRAIAAGTANAMSWDIGHFTLREVETIIPDVEILAC